MLGLLLLTASCQTFMLRDGKKYRQFAPVKDFASIDECDTTRFVKQQFVVSNYTDKVAFNKNKRIITTIEGNDLKQLAATGKQYHIYFYNPTCQGTCESIKHVETKFSDQENVILISLREDIDAMDNMLAQTRFGKYPYYVLESKTYSKGLILKQRNFIKDACSTCYDKYKDEVAFAEYVLIQNGTIEPVMFK